MAENLNPGFDDPVIQVQDIRKSFGVLQALDGVSFELSRGDFLTIFGPNGAGKTTLIKVLAGLTRPTGGRARVAGHDVLQSDPRLRRQIGVISHASCLYADLSALENLVFYGRMYGLDRPGERAVRALEEVGLKPRMHDRVRTFSRGMQQRVSIARAVLHDPSVLFLDEPFTGLDPHGAHVLRNYLHALHDRHRTVIMTTHDLACGLEMGDKVAVQARGRIVLMEETRRLDRDHFEARYFEAVQTRAPAP